MKCPFRNCNNEATINISGAAGIFQKQCAHHASQSFEHQERGHKMQRQETALKNNKSVREASMHDDDILIREDRASNKERGKVVSFLLSIIN